MDVGCADAIASKLAPTGMIGVLDGWLKNNQCSVAYTQHGL